MPISKSSQALRSAASTATRATAATTTPTDSRFGSAARSPVSPKLPAASRAAVEPVIGHLKGDHGMRRNHLKGHNGDRVNAVLAAYNFSLVLRWFEQLLRVNSAHCPMGRTIMLSQLPIRGGRPLRVRGVLALQDLMEADPDGERRSQRHVLI
jgi:hypothetical protein